MTVVTPLSAWRPADGWDVRYEVRDPSGDVQASYTEFGEAMNCAYQLMTDGPIDICEVRTRRIASLVQKEQEA